MAKQKAIKKPAVDNIVQPIIREEGVPHVLESMFNKDPNGMPTLKSIGYAKIDGTNSYVSYVLTTKGREVLCIEVAEPDMRAIAEESTKINFVEQFMNTGF